MQKGGNSNGSLDLYQDWQQRLCQWRKVKHQTALRQLSFPGQSRSVLFFVFRSSALRGGNGPNAGRDIHPVRHVRRYPQRPACQCVPAVSNRLHGVAKKRADGLKNPSGGSFNRAGLPCSRSQPEIIPLKLEDYGKEGLDKNLSV
jgi:hypothetical protein